MLDDLIATLVETAKMSDPEDRRRHLVTMLPTPTTPGKSDNGHTNTPSNNKKLLCSASKHANTCEPSPASTYGGTARSDSVPATPIDGIEFGLPKYHTAGLDPIVETPNLGFGSPSSKQAPVYNISLNHSPNGQTPRGAFNYALKSIPSGTPKLTSNLGVTHVGSSAFVHSSDNDGDPFIASWPASDAASGQGARAIPTGRSQSANATPTRSSDRSVGQLVTPSSTIATTTNTARYKLARTNNVVSPRVDRRTEKISAANAQGIFEPRACVFVANLDYHSTDEELRVAIEGVFGAFGRVYVKVARDSTGMPFAFAQFETGEDAELAVFRGNHQIIRGRACRTEISNAKRALYVTRRDGNPIDETAVIEHMNSFMPMPPPIDSCYVPDTDECTKLKLSNDGIWIRFHFYQDFADTYKAMRHDTEYYFRRVLQLRSDYNTRRGRIPAQQMLRPGLPVPGQHQESDPARSIVLTNLPVLTTVQELFTLFGRYGQITSVKQVAKPSEPVASLIWIYALVEFANPNCATLATAENGRLLLDGNRLGVRKATANSPQDLPVIQARGFGNQAPVSIPIYYPGAFGHLNANAAGAPSPQYFYPVGLKSAYEKTQRR